MRDWENIAFVGVVIASIAVIVFVIMQSGNVSDCTKRGGTVIDTAGGWVCAKIERI
jgi:preprotein translocase subunit SecG